MKRTWWIPCGLIAALAAVGSGEAPAYAQAQGYALRPPPQSARVFARDGSLIAELGPEVRTVVALKSLPAYVPKAFVAVEDRRFFEHTGVDPVGVARAVKANVQGGFGSEGASTITQQLVGAMFPEAVDRREKSVERKLKEAKIALELERRYGKERLLEAYLNEIYFGHGWYGIEAAARHYFGKPAAQLAIEEAALLAALPKGPGVYSPKINPQRALERRNLVLGIMADAGVISDAQAEAARRRPIRLAANHGYSARPPWVIEEVRRFLEAQYGPTFGTNGLRVWTTIEPAAQTAADSALSEGLRHVEAQPWFRGPRLGTAEAKPTAAGTPYLQGAVVSVDARTGEILALTGGRDWNDSKFNRVTQARRQPGSSFKPVVYAAAVERGTTPATVMEDTALHILLPGSPVYEPKNSDNQFRGPVTIREALRESVNTVAIQLGMEVGLSALSEAARRFGIESAVPPYPSSAIGAAAVRPLEMAEAYTALANRGVRVEPFLIRRVADARGNVLFDAKPQAQRVTTPAVAFVVTDLLRDAAERGTGRAARERLQPAVPMAGKTGTTNDGTDVWYMGYTPEIVTGVWIGFDRPKPIGSGAFGGTVAAPIWADVMRQIYARRPAPEPWAVPAGVVVVGTDPQTGLPLPDPCPAIPMVPEYFVRGTEPLGACVLNRAALPADSLPADALPMDSIPPDSTAAPEPDTAGNP